MQDYQFYGLFLDTGIKNKLMDILTDTIDYNIALNVADKIYIDHCTLMHISQKQDWLEDTLNIDLGRKYHIILDKIGISDKAMAFGVLKNGIVSLCRNEIPHITIATFRGGKPVDSNKITKWKDIKPIIITAKLEKR